MARLTVLVVALAGLISAVPCDAEPASGPGAIAPSSIIRFRAEEPIQVRQRGFSFPVVDYTDERGVRQQRKGIIASQTIAPGTLLGIGFYETVPKSRGWSSEPPSNISPRRTKRAAVGFSWRF